MHALGVSSCMSLLATLPALVCQAEGSFVVSATVDTLKAHPRKISLTSPLYCWMRRAGLHYPVSVILNTF